MATGCLNWTSQCGVLSLLKRWSMVSGKGDYNKGV